MKKIKLLDCTLRDGGYINDWHFGHDNVVETLRNLERSNTDIIEVGFLRDEAANLDRTVFNSVESIAELIREKNPSIEYAAMAEAAHPIPPELISEHSAETIDIIRVIVWKDKHDKDGNVFDALREGYEYCKHFVDKGYKLFVQPARVEQYSDQEFLDMLKLYSDLHPAAIYIVDSWGTMYADEVMHYFKIADDYLDPNIAIGFHGHNNLMQVFANSVEFLNADTNRERIIDSSVYGIGRGAGNLNSETIAKYLNEREGKKYEIRNFVEIYENCIKDIYGKHFWGYSVAYYLTGLYHANPQYATYYGVKNNIPGDLIDTILRNMSNEDRVLYYEPKAEEYLIKYSNL